MDLSLGGWENGVSLKMSQWGRQFADQDDTSDVEYFGLQVPGDRPEQR